MLVFDHDVDFVLKHDDVFKLHYINSNQMLTGLRLGVRLVTSDQ